MPKIIYHDSSGIERSIELGADQVLIGRAAECQIQTQDGLVSRRHAHIVVRDGLYWIEDLGSANGVYVNSQRVQQAQLRPGDEVVCGSLSLRFVADIAAAIRRTQGMAAYSDPPASAASQPASRTSQQPPGGAELELLRAELESERRRRTDAEFARDEALRQVQELAARAASAGDGEELARLRRRNDQLESELRRARGAGAAPAPGGEALRAVEAERDRLRARVAELEAQGTRGGGAVDDMEMLRLQRRVEQLQSEIRRLRSGGGEAPAALDTGRVAELEDKVRRLEQERDEALRRAMAPPPPPAAGPDPQLADELMRARRQVEQLQSEIRRLRSGGGAAAPAPEPQGDLDAALRQLRDVERERDALRALVATGHVGKPKPPARALECLTAVSDGLADIRGALRAAGDEVALEQLEQIRGQLREAMELLGS